MAPASRMAARLADLSHAQLLEIAAAGCEASTQVKNRADGILAAHKLLAQWAVEGVLLSNDLVPRLLAPLQLEDGAAAAVCSRWAAGWKATSEGRRRLRRVALDFPQDLLGKDSFEMAATPGGDKLVVRSGTTARILGRGMSTVSSFELPTMFGELAASDEFIYAVDPIVDDEYVNQVRCFTHTGTEVAKYTDPDRVILYPTLAPGGLLFCFLFDGENEPAQHEIVALDAQTLQPLHRFGLSLLKGAMGSAVVGEELFVPDPGNDRLQVFSLAGEHRRSITGEWKRPAALCFVKDRLYLIEEYQDERDLDGELIYSQPGQRIFVLSLQGDTLQVYTPWPHLAEGQIFVDLCCFDGKLLATIHDNRFGGYEVLALRGV